MAINFLTGQIIDGDVVIKGAQLGFEDAASTGTIYLYNDGAATSKLNIGGTMWVEEAGKVFINASTSIPSRNENFQVTGQQIITNTGTNDATLYLGYNSSGSTTVQLGRGRTADGLSYIDLNGEVMAAGDYGFRIMRRAGVNAITDLIQVGTGSFTINALNGADTVFTNTNVGIGTTSPADKLHVMGTVRSVVATGSGFGFMTNRGTGGSCSGIRWDSNNSSLTLKDSTEAITTHIRSSGFSYLNGGKVGIGTTSPDYKLEVNGTLGVNRTDGIIFTGSTANGNKITVDTSNDFIFSTSLVSAPYTVSEKIRIANNGAIGIGGANYGTSGQVLTSNGNAAPSWQAGGSGTVTGTGTTGRVIKFTDGANGVIGDSILAVTADSLDFTNADFAQIKFRESGAITIDSDNDQSSRNFQIKDGSGSSLLTILDTGNVGINETTPAAFLDIQPSVSNRKVTRIANDVTSTYFYNQQVDAILAWTCVSYYQAEVVITANQTNGGTTNNLYIRGIWSNNNTSHHWDELEHIGSLTGSTFTMSVGQNGSTTASGRLELDFNYGNGSFSQLNVRVTDFYGVHSYTIT